MSQRIHSKIFGVVVAATQAQRETIDQLVSNFPVDVFQSLNKMLNARGLRLGIAGLREQAEAENRMDPNDIMSDPRIRNSGPVAG